MAKKRVNSRDKGGRGERQAKEHLQEWWGCDFARTPGSGAFATITGMEDYAGDVRPVNNKEWFPLSIEVKNAEGWLIENMLKSDLGPLWQYWKQTVRQGEFEGRHPMLLFTRNFQPWWYMTYDEAPAWNGDDTIPVNEAEFTARLSLRIPGQKFVVQNLVFHKDLVIGLVEDLKRTDKEDLRCLITR